MELPKPPTVEGGVSDADIIAYGAACWRGGYRKAMRDAAAWSMEFARRVMAKADEPPPLSVRMPGYDGTRGELVQVDPVRGSLADPGSAVPSVR